MNENRLHAQLRTFKEIKDQYESAFRNTPLARFLSSYFKAHPKMGSGDRRTASTLLYDYYRLGRACPGPDLYQRLALALFLCEDESAFCTLLNPRLSKTIAAELDAKLVQAGQEMDFKLKDIFPGLDAVSPEVDIPEFLKNHLIRPRVYMYTYPGKQAAVKHSLDQNAISYIEHGAHTLSVLSGTPLQNISALKGTYEIQDFASQQVENVYQAKPGEQWWDACAGSGGKAIVFSQQHPQVQLTVSDIRPSILRNLEARFEQAGLQVFRKKILDLRYSIDQVFGDTLFDGILLDAPCSGSGTWSRTPEMLSSFSPKDIASFAQRQEQMATHVLPFLKPGKPLVYVTCSVYRQENEAVVEALINQGMQLESMQYIKGYTQGGDTLFVARLIKGK